MQNIRPTFILGLLVLAAAGLSGPAVAQEEDTETNAQYRLLRQEETWHDANGPNGKGLHALKYRPVGAGRAAFVTVGGEVRTYARWYRNKGWGAGPDRERAVLQRLMLHGVLETPRRSGEAYARLFGQLRSGVVTGRAGPPYPTDRDLLGFNQAFLEVGAPLASGRSVLLRFGRQELHYGAGRMIAAREGPNVRLGYDAVLARYVGDAWRADAFVAKPTEAAPGVFDNGWMPGRTLWGAYLRRQAARLSLAVYYLGTERAPSPQRRSLWATRHTIGGRAYGQWGPVGYDLEGAVQVGLYQSMAAGDNRSGAIRAWTVAGRLTYRRSGSAGQQAVGVLFDLSSGDVQDTERLETFAAPYPSGRFTGAGSQLGPGNLINLGPFATLPLPRTLSLTLKGHFFWRLRETGGTYAIWGASLRPVPSSSARFIGVMPEMALTWTAGPHTTLAVKASHFVPGQALEENPPARGLTHVGLRATYKF